MAATTVQEREGARRVRQLSSLAREIARAALTAELAADRRDIDCLDDAITALTEMQEHLRAEYRQLLVAGIRRTM
jgi:hypothetical protein